LKLARTKEWRESHGLTQRELAAEAGVGEVTVARIETGASVTPPTARKIAEALGVAVADLLEQPPVPLAKAAVDAARRDEEKAAKAVRRLFAGEGVLKSTNMVDFEEDRFRADLRDLGLPDELFETLIWPLVTELRQETQKIAQLEAKIARLEYVEEENVRLREEHARLRQDITELRSEAEREGARR
jgi:transcriptional regulator with XRE-family HTH domain